MMGRFLLVGMGRVTPLLQDSVLSVMLCVCILVRTERGSMSGDKLPYLGTVDNAFGEQELLFFFFKFL
jgi:hypothetical protein